MPLDDVWVSGPFSDAKLSAVAGTILIDRLHTVYCAAPLAGYFDELDVEFVHKLRVSTRRAHAALQLFRPLLPTGRRKRWCRRLREIRRAAGPARNLDVLLLRWQNGGTHGLTLPTPFLEAVRTCRQAVQRPLRKTLDDLDWAEYIAEWQELIARTRWRATVPEPNWRAAAVAWMEQPFSDYLEAGYKLLQRSAGDYNIDDLHAFRIHGKRVRYALEICESAFPRPSYQGLARRLKRIQDRLGKINDHATALKQLDQWRACGAFQGKERDLNQLVEYEATVLKQAALRFLAKWSSGKLQQSRLAWQACRSPSPSPSSSPT